MRGMVLAIILLLSAVLIACGDGEPETSPRVQLTLPPIASSTPRPTIQPATFTPLPTAIQWWPTLPPETIERPVTVSRVSDSVDPTQNLLLQEGEAVPPIILTDIDGNLYQLDELAGKPVIINFWTVGCGSCFHEFPLLQAMYEQVGDDVIILAVNVSDLPQETQTLADSLGVTYPMIVDPDGGIFIEFFGGAVVPTTYVISADGTVFDTIVGPLDQNVLAGLIAEFDLQS